MLASLNWNSKSLPLAVWIESKAKQNLKDYIFIAYMLGTSGEVENNMLPLRY